MAYDPNECDRQLTAKGLNICGRTVSDKHCIDLTLIIHPLTPPFALIQVVNIFTILFLH